MNIKRILKALIALLEAFGDNIPGQLDEYIVELLKKVLEGQKK